jgi:hypothetical protein
MDYRLPNHYRTEQRLYFNLFSIFLLLPNETLRMESMDLSTIRKVCRRDIYDGVRWVRPGSAFRVPLYKSDTSTNLVYFIYYKIEEFST